MFLIYGLPTWRRAGYYWVMENITIDMTGPISIPITCDIHDSAKIDDLVILQGNLKTLSEENYNKLKKQMVELGFSFPFFVWAHDGILEVLDGTHRKLAVKKMENEGYNFPDLFPIHKIHAKDKIEAKRKLLAVTSHYAKITPEGLDEFMVDTGWDYDYINENFDIGLELPNSSGNGDGAISPSMADKFLIPPFSVLNAREGWWQDRKRQWIAMGIQSELGRGGGQQVASFKSQERLDQFRLTKKTSQRETENMPKYAMNNDPKVRHERYEKKISRPGHNAGRVASERERERGSMRSAINGGE